MDLEKLKKDTQVIIDDVIKQTEIKELELEIEELRTEVTKLKECLVELKRAVIGW